MKETGRPEVLNFLGSEQSATAGSRDEFWKPENRIMIASAGAASEGINLVLFGLPHARASVELET